MTTTAPRRRWFRFRLGTLLVIVAISAIPLAWIAKERRQSQFEQQLGPRLRGLGFDEVVFAGPFDSVVLLDGDKPQGWWQDLARRTLGERIIAITKINFGEAAPKLTDLTVLSTLTNLQVLHLGDAPVTDIGPLTSNRKLTELFLNGVPVADFSLLSQFPALTDLDLSGTSINDVTPLAALHDLRALHLHWCPVTDLSPISGLDNLEILDLTNTAVRDVSHLTRLKKLKELYLYDTPVTKEQIESLQKALPNCKIHPDEFR